MYPYEKWSNKELPEYREGQEFEPTACLLKSGMTTRPALLTEADLVGLMDKNGIGEFPMQNLMIGSITHTSQARMQRLRSISKRSWIGAM